MTEKRKPAFGILSNCGFMIRQSWRQCKSILPICLGIIFCGVAANLLELFVLPAILDAVARGVPPLSLVSLIAWFALAMVFVRAFRKYLDTNRFYGRMYLRCQFAAEAQLHFCRTSFCHTEDPAFLKRIQGAFRALNSDNSSSEAIWDTGTLLLTNLISFTLYLLLLAQVGPWFALFCMAVSTAGYFAGEHLRSWRYRHQDEEAQNNHRLFYIIERSHDTKLAKDVRIFGIAPWLAELYSKYVQLVYDFYDRLYRRYFWADLLDAGLALLRNGGAYAVLIAMAIRGTLTPPEFVLYFTAVSGFTEWVTGIFSQLGVLHRQSQEISLLREVWGTPEPYLFEEGKPLPVRQGHAYSLELRDVSFRYPGAEEDTLSHVNLTLHPGEKIAVVGKNGAGKTTLVKLLCGLYDPTEGQVLLDGEDIRSFNRWDYYAHFTAVFQQFSPLVGTMAENVGQCPGPEVDLPRMWDCMERAGIAEKIRSLPQREQTQLGRDIRLEGVELSGGQLQRLMLARALYKDAPIVLLDEPTAALDPLAESDLYRKYSDLTGGRTSVYISHRLASTRFCDRVLLIENGGIAEEGTHEELLAMGGRYARLFGIQSRYYQEGAMEDV